VGRYLQLSMIFYIVGSLPGIIIWPFLTDDTVLWFGFDEETARIAQGYAYPFLAIGIFNGINDCVHNFLDIMDYEKYSTVCQLLHFGCQTLVVIIMAAAGSKDLVMIGIAQAFIACITMISNLAFVLYKGWMDPYWEGFFLTLSLRVSLGEACGLFHCCQLC
jgi:Na+-driven multidrug efflux pump